VRPDGGRGSSTLERLVDPFTGAPTRLTTAERWRRHWTYTKAVVRKFRGRLYLLATVLMCGAAAFRLLYVSEEGERATIFEGLYYTWCLIFFEPQVELPDSLVLDILFFVIPILGLGVLVETFLELSMTLRDRRLNEREWCRMIAAEMKNHVVLVGFGRLGYRTYGHLRRMHMHTVVIEAKADNRFLETARMDGTPVLIGDGRVDEVLREANVARAASIICCTNDDLANLEIGLDARAFNPDIRVVLRMFDQNMANKVRDGFNIHVAFSTAAMSAPAFAAAAADRSIKSSALVDGRLVVTSEIVISPQSCLAGRTLDYLLRQIPMNVVSHQRPGKRAALFAPPETALNVGDTLLLQLQFADLKALHAINQTGAAEMNPVP